ncbi:ATP-binding protein [Ferrovibrio sp.]|uniref:ATP-binding protein n=1 Tax=Ferrovibrio sp. TaxID=1917215 RepID=UPI00260C8AC7|nr:ATP-binding protein [Ferrovibrio sp.]
MASRPKKAAKKAPRPAAAKVAPPPADAALLLRIADALERLAPPRAPDWDETAADAFAWHAEPAPGWLEAVPQVNAVSINLLQGVERVRDILLDNTTRFARGLPANNALLWGARGMGKSSLVKAAIGAINGKKAHALALVEIHREDIPSLPQLLKILRKSKRRFVLFCDDLSFDAEDQHYKSLKAVLDGGIEGRPDNVILYATSNRRHLLPRDMMENERSTAINPHEAVEEKVSLSDRFGLWLGFHSCSQEDFFAMLDGYCAAYGLKIDQKQLRAEAVEWSMTRGARSGRVAWQFIQDLAGRLGKPLKPAR